MSNSVTLQEVLDNKEQRAKRQQKLLGSFAPLVSISVNIPGDKKSTADSKIIFDALFKALIKTLTTQKIEHKTLFIASKKTGQEAIVHVNFNALLLKKLTCKIENKHFLGRFIDMDIIESGKILSRSDIQEEPRTCYICSKQATLCGRNRTHSTKELIDFIHQQVVLYKKSLTIANFAKEAMLKEINLTPKPGLVDKDNSGAHNDMDKYTFYRSIEAIAPYLKEFIWCGYTTNKSELFNALRHIGLACETSMFQATKGINTHKGLIFSLAVILGSYGLLLKKERPLTIKNLQECLRGICKNLMQKDLKKIKEASTAGEKYFLETKNGGIREEAQNGYPTLFELAYPFFLTCRKDFDEEKALKLTLLKIISFLPDTTLYNRKGKEGVFYAQQEAKKALKTQYHELDKTLQKLDKNFVTKNLSPGGSADILALTYLVDKTIN